MNDVTNYYAYEGPDGKVVTCGDEAELYAYDNQNNLIGVYKSLKEAKAALRNEAKGIKFS